jgi:hypothetical protein
MRFGQLLEYRRSKTMPNAGPVPGDRYCECPTEIQKLFTAAH